MECAPEIGALATDCCPYDITFSYFFMLIGIILIIVGVFKKPKKISK